MSEPTRAMYGATKRRGEQPRRETTKEKSNARLALRHAPSDLSGLRYRQANRRPAGAHHRTPDGSRRQGAAFRQGYAGPIRRLGQGAEQLGREREARAIAEAAASWLPTRPAPERVPGLGAVRATMPVAAKQEKLKWLPRRKP